jgi:hypothetical protein
VRIETESDGAEGNDDKLPDEDNEQNEREHVVGEDALEYVELILYATGVDEVEELQHHECVEDVCELN